MYAQLVPCGGGAPLPLKATRVVVGRAAGNDIVLPFTTVSTQHCELQFRDGQWHVRDLGSRNGIRVNGVRCQESPISPGGVLTIADRRFQLIQNAPASGSTISRREETQATVAAAVLASSPTPSRAAPRKSSNYLGELIPCGGGPAIPLLKEQLVLGRSRSCDVVLPHPTISGRHCQLTFQHGYWHIRDLGSSNGLRVNGDRYLSKYLKPGEIVCIATQRYEITFTPQANEPPPDEDPFALSLLEKAGLSRRDAAGHVPEFRPPPDPSEHKRWVIDERDV